MGCNKERALFTSCESWYRFHDAGIMNFWDGRGYGVCVEKNTGIVCVSETILMNNDISPGKQFEAATRLEAR